MRWALTTRVLPLLLLTSCHPGVVVDWFNHTGARLALVVSNPGSPEMRYEVKADGVVRTGVSSALKIEIGGRTWMYEPPLVPAEFIRRKNALVSVVRLQIEPDGSIYLVRPEAKQADALYQNQPRGFPVKPKATDDR